MRAELVEAFIARWQAAGGSERANYQLFITTNSLRQTFNRRVVQGTFDQGLHLAFAAPGVGEGRLCSVTAEREGKGEGLEVELAERSGSIHADLIVGAGYTALNAK